MSDKSAAQQMFELWKAQVEEGARVWSKLLAQTPAAPPDPAAFWRPVVEQWTEAWARALAQTPMTPDVMGQWKQFLDQSIEAWSRALGQAMGTEAFAQILGRSLDQWLAAYAPMKKVTEQSVDAALEVLNLASRKQLTAVARQLITLEERIERLEDGVGEVLRRLDELARAPRPAGPSPAEPA